MATIVKFDDRYNTARPYLASFVLLKKDNKIAMILRKNTGFMNGCFGVPAGKVEYHETFSQAAVRESLEEAGVTIDESDLQFVHVVHRHHQDDAQFMDWVDMYFVVERWEGEPHNAEPNKGEELRWFDLNNLPDNVVTPQLAALQAIARGEAYSTFGW